MHLFFQQQFTSAPVRCQIILPYFAFSITSKTLPNKDIIATIADAVKDLEKEEPDMIHAKITFPLQNSKPPKNNLPKLRKNYNLIH